MSAQILETISKDEKEQVRLFDEWLYETDLLARERYAVRVGKEEAIKENSMKIAKSLKMKGLPPNLIFETTGIPLEVLQTL